MTTIEQQRWTLDELCAAATRALAENYAGAPNARVRAVPDARTIRYYTTLGLLDRPRIEGRTALYGRQHLLQLVALKRLQAEGLSLGQVQQRLFGLSRPALEKLAQLPGNLEDASRARPETAFWKAVPAPVTPPSTSEPTPALVRLDDGVFLLLNQPHPFNDRELATLRAAAAPLLKRLATLRAAGPSHSQEEPS